MAKYLIIFGAGASYGSDTGGLIPPLGAQLFDELARYNPNGWGSITGDLVGKFRSDFEAGMIDLSNQNSHALPPLQRAMAAYFFNFLPRKTNLYYSLANKIKAVDWDGALITFNYERLLEISLSVAGVQPCVGSVPASNNKNIELCLPHGCCHFFCESVFGSARGVSFSGMNVSTNGPIKVISNPQEFQQRIQNDAFPPAMSYFEPQKRTTSGNNFILAQRNRFAELVKSAEKIILVGIRVREHDGHVWEPLKKTKAQLIYISGAPARQEFESWGSVARPNNADIAMDGYFADSFNMILDQVELN